MPRTPMPPQAQGNRTDLLTPQPGPQAPGQPNGQPVRLPTGLPYGERQQLQQQQQAAPLPQTPSAPVGRPAPPQAPPGPQGPQSGAPGLDVAGAMEAARQFQPPNLGGLTRGTERPNEPVTAGLPSTPQATPPSGGSLAGTLAKMAAASGSAALTQLAQRAGILGQ